MSEAHGHQTKVASAGKSKEHGISDQHRLGHGGRKPHGQHENHAQRDGDDHHVEPPDAIGKETGEHTAQDRPGVEVRQEQIALSRILSMPRRVRDDVRQGHEQTPLHEEDTDRREGIAKVPEPRKVGQKRRNLGFLVGDLGLQTGLDKKVGWHGEAEHNEAEDAATPGKPNRGESIPQHDGKHDTTDATGNSGNTCCQSAAHIEKVRDGSVRRAVKKGTAQATEHGVCQHDLIISCVSVVSSMCHKQLGAEMARTYSC